MPLLPGRRVLITGASSGIGAAAAEVFAREGADLALVARSETGLEAVAARARAQGVRAYALPADLGLRSEVERVVEEAVAALGGLDVLLWNAASMAFGRFHEVAPEDFDRTIAITFTAAVDTVRAALPHLERSGGAIVATASISAKTPLGAFSSYASAKHALRGFLGSLRIELQARRSPVTVSMVHPGPVDTPLWASVTSATSRQPRNPPAPYAPEEIARALLAVAVEPRAETTIGLEARAIEWLAAFARPVADVVLVLVERYSARSQRPSPRPGGLWEPQGAGRASAGLHGRPSLWAALRVRPGLRRAARAKRRPTL
jgi:NAD(P)-dependent dehydrogenase (short-subunit alcohol dehydrogenase family)